MNAPAAIDDAVFERLMAPLGPFEQKPKLALAVSGGADSLALTILAARWAVARQGIVLALTVDHGLRPEAAAEARQVGRWLAARRVKHKVLTWDGPKPATGLQAAARNARYRLLLDHCEGAGILHLLLAHHQGDQAETVLLRLAGRSGMDGLAAIARVTTTASVRLLRPLLNLPKAALEETLREQGQSWVEDPSNRNQAFARVRMREAMPSLAEAGVTADALAGLAGEARDLRMAFDDGAATLLAEAATVSAVGFVKLTTATLLCTQEVIGRRALDHVLRMVGGSIYPPRGDRLDRLWAEIRAGLKQRRSLGGCLVAPGRDALLIQREPAAMAEAIPCQAGEVIHWDGRFKTRLAGQGRGKVGALTQRGWLAIKGELGRQTLPASVFSTMPALFDGRDNPVAVPHLGWKKQGYRGLELVDLAFAPASPLTGGLVWHPSSTMC
ncbi:MAG TPA: tRNA lysidine(34) synthetase TilS [Magnetospirillaceae bacterium]|jgi:tRNA(Ile)-lysidine synthase